MTAQGNMMGQPFETAFVVRAAAALAAALGLLVLVGWQFNLSGLKSILPGAVEMKANTALGILAAGIVLYALRAGLSPTNLRRVQALALVVASLGLATMSQYAFDWQLGIDELLFRDTGVAFNLIRGRMSPYSAVAFGAIGLALAALPHSRLRALAWTGATLTLAIGTVSFLGYLWNANELITDRLVPPVAVHTAVGFVLLGAGTLLARHQFAAVDQARPTAMATVETRILVSFVGGLVVLVIGGGYIYRGSAAFEESERGLSHARQVHLNLGDIYSASAQAKSDQMAYLLTGAQAHADSYARHIDETRAGLEAVRGLVADDPAKLRMLQEIDSLLADGFDAMSASMQLYRQGRAAKALELVRAGEWTRTLQALRAAMDRLETAENALLWKRQEALAQSRQTTLLTILISLGAAVAAVIFLLRGIRKASAARTAAERALVAEFDAAVERGAEIQLANRFLDSVIENIPNMVFVKDAADLRFLRFNRAGEALLGCRREDLLGREDHDLFPKEQADVFVAKDREALATGALVDVPQERLLTRHQGERILHTRKIPIVDESGQARYLLGISEDITEQEGKKAEILRLNEQLQLHAAAADSANRAKSTFLATMSHEIRTPMNGMLGMLELLSLSPLDADQRGTLDVVRESSRSLLRIIDDILDFSKIEAGKLDVRPEVCSIQNVIEEVHSIYGGNASSRGLLIKRSVDPRISPAVRVDPLRLRQILNNFVSNALKFTQDGAIEIVAEWVAREGDAEQIRFLVKDTGIGISAEDQALLFQPFHQGSGDAARRAGGTGLGLTICQRLAALMGGSVGMESELGRGTTMTLTLCLPIADAALLPRWGRQAPSPAGSTVRVGVQAPVADQAERDGTLVLVVDDHPTNRNLLVRQLRMLGYAAEIAQHGLEALERCKARRYGLIITDCHMPEMDGYELARTLRRAEAEHGAPRIPIVACTANALSGEAQACLDSGMDDCLVKPVELAALSRTLDRWLGLPGLREREPIDVALIANTWGAEPSTLREILAEFRRATDDDVTMLRRALAVSDIAQAANAAHRMLGASRMVGALDFASTCERLEAAGRSSDWPGVLAAMPAFEGEYARLNACIDGLSS